MAGLAENTLMEDDPCCTYHLDNIAESVNLPTSKPGPIQFSDPTLRKMASKLFLKFAPVMAIHRLYTNSACGGA
jgi:hypothetical protein